MTENWLPVVGYEGLYEVSDRGRVRGLARVMRRRDKRLASKYQSLIVPGRDLHPWPVQRGGYPAVMLCRNGHKRLIPVHSLVLAAFVGPRPKGADSLHYDGDPSNCRLSNLRYGSRAENMGDMRRHGRIHTGERWHERPASRQYRKG
jgi:hypothetical protein